MALTFVFREENVRFAWRRRVHSMGSLTTSVSPAPCGTHNWRFMKCRNLMVLSIAARAKRGVELETQRHGGSQRKHELTSSVNSVPLCFMFQRAKRNEA